MESALNLHRTETPLRQPLRSALIDSYRRVRATTENLCRPLATEDYVVQPMADVSPPKWHLAHTTWFFEKFFLAQHSPDYLPVNPLYDRLFNSYYETVGAPFPRAQRGTLSRPTVDEIYQYRKAVDTAVLEFLVCSAEPVFRASVAVLELGLQHEQQHQELLLTDIKYILWSNPLRPAYRPPLSPTREAAPAAEAGPASPCRVTHFYKGGLLPVGAHDQSFHFDNEAPRHLEYIHEFVMDSCLVTNGDYLEFIEGGGYRNSTLWHSEGWKRVHEAQWQAPLYWEQDSDKSWWTMTFDGMKRVDLSAPVSHVSFFEASAYASFRSARLPTEFEWEHAASQVPVRGNFLESGLFEPAPSQSSLGGPSLSSALQEHPTQLFGDVWEWTQSAYLPYPGFRPLEGSLGEYNGKFMCNQFVLRGGSCATPISHIRSSYRNFFPPDARWQFSGFRLANIAIEEDV